MKHCTQCGHQLGLGRFCTNCGAPVVVRDPLADDWTDTTAERATKRAATAAAAAPRPVVDPAPRLPPVAVEPPPPPRFPLFADEVAAPAAAPAAVAEPTDDWADDDDQDWEEWDDEGRPRFLRVLAAVVVLAVLVVGAWFLGQQIGGDDDAQDPSSGRSGGSADAAGDAVVDRTAEASAEAPSTAPPGEDVDGQATSYDASNMLDGVPETAWRMVGDGTGAKLVFTFPEKTRITQVGLINGYAKKARDGGKVLDWYEGHRRIQRVTWIFAGGRTVKQDLSDDRSMQTIDVEPVEVKRVVLKIVATSEPGSGAARRDMTAISDVLLAEN